MDAEVDGKIEGTMVISNVVWVQLLTGALSICDLKSEFWVISQTDLLTCAHRARLRTTKYVSRC